METASTGQALPAVAFVDDDGDKATLDDFKGKTVLVNLWATWCTPCIAELPSLDRLQDKIDAKSKGAAFEVVAISLDRADKADKIKSFLSGQKIEGLDFYWDKNREIPSKWSYAGIPTSFLLNARGEVVEKFEGPYEWDSPEMVAKIAAVVTAP